jgi:hypothetical protein
MEFVEESGGWMFFEKEWLLFENQRRLKTCAYHCTSALIQFSF